MSSAAIDGSAIHSQEHRDGGVVLLWDPGDDRVLVAGCQEASRAGHGERRGAGHAGLEEIAPGDIVRIDWLHGWLSRAP
ncbi:MAG: hypothetical protein R2712_22215 [Vicinamibacterales bacterium]